MVWTPISSLKLISPGGARVVHWSRYLLLRQFSRFFPECIDVSPIAWRNVGIKVPTLTNTLSLACASSTSIFEFFEALVLLVLCWIRVSTAMCRANYCELKLERNLGRCWLFFWWSLQGDRGAWLERYEGMKWAVSMTGRAHTVEKRRCKCMQFCKRIKEMSSEYWLEPQSEGVYPD